jgi:dihydrofolate reductase
LAQLLWEDRHTEIYYVWILFGHIRIKSTYIITRSHIGEKNNENIHCITENIIEKIEKIKEGKGSDIGLVGGGVLTKTLLRHDLVDEMIIYTVPILLGGGIPLFPPFFPISNWCIEKTELLKNGVMQTTYCKSTL